MPPDVRKSLCVWLGWLFAPWPAVTLVAGVTVAGPVEAGVLHVIHMYSIVCIILFTAN